MIAEHTLNKNSSRSHCIFTIYIEVRAPAVFPRDSSDRGFYVAGSDCISALFPAKRFLDSLPLQSRFRAFSDVKCVTSKINLIDLAGSERLSKTGVSNGRNIAVINTREVK